MWARDTSFMDELMGDIRRRMWLREGRRHKPEPPTLVAKVCEGLHNGNLYVGPLPTPDNLLISYS